MTKATSREKLVAHTVKKAWCAYYDPDRKTFGRPSRCVDCCVNSNTRAYDPDRLNRDCSRYTIIDGCLPGLDEVLLRGF